MRLNGKIILNIIGLLLAINGFFMLASAPISLIYRESAATALLLSGGLTIVLGLALWFFTKNNEASIKKRDGYLIVTLGWLAMTLTGTLPYILSGTIPTFTNAFFETISGYTTTGATILSDIESSAKGILFWRSLTQWMGGMGIIVLTIAILPILGIGGMELFVAEAPGPSAEKLHPRIKETAKRLWMIYVGLTALQTISLKLAGMGFYDAVNHAMTTISIGGFSTKNASIAHFDSPLIQYIIIVFMMLAGTNFSLTYFGVKGKLSKLYKNEEFRVFIGLVVVLTLVVSIVNYFLLNASTEITFRESLFQVVSIATTTGFVTADYTSWTPLLVLIFFLLMFVGGSAGSTAGGVKLVRHIIIIKNSLMEFKKILHPAAILPVRYNGKAIGDQTSRNVLSFFLIYQFIFIISMLILVLTGSDWITSAGAAASSLGNVGPGFGNVGPVDNYACISPFGKIYLSFLMLVGRLELFTVLILFTPYFWKRT